MTSRSVIVQFVPVARTFKENRFALPRALERHASRFRDTLTKTKGQTHNRECVASLLSVPLEAVADFMKALNEPLGVHRDDS
jgi:hypothetical protein